MDTQSPNQPFTQSTVPPKEIWTEPVLRSTPIAETAGGKITPGGDGIDAFSS